MFRYGIEHELALQHADGRFADPGTVSFDALQAVVDVLPEDPADYPALRIGDAGINAAVPDDFWETTKETVLSQFRSEKYVAGLEQGIQMVGEQLRRYFPYNATTDKNELDDSISFGGDTPRSSRP